MYKKDWLLNQIDDLVVEFYVKKDNFNNEDYPKKFQAIKMYYK